MIKKLYAMLPMCATVMTLVGCSSTGVANNGAGFSMLHPSSATRSFVIEKDRAFALEIASHNATCQKQPACTK